MVVVPENEATRDLAPQQCAACLAADLIGLVSAWFDAPPSFINVVDAFGKDGQLALSLVQPALDDSAEDTGDGGQKTADPSDEVSRWWSRRVLFTVFRKLQIRRADLTRRWETKQQQHVSR